MMLQTLLVAYLITLSASSLQMETLSFAAAMCPVKNTSPDALPWNDMGAESAVCDFLESYIFLAKNSLVPFARFSCLKCNLNSWRWSSILQLWA